MRKTVSKFALAAGLALAMAFTISCGQHDGSGDDGNIGTCGGKEYDTMLGYTCERGELVGYCKGQPYYPEYQSCVNGEIKDGMEISSSSNADGNLLSSSSAGEVSDLDIFAVDISQETDEWNYMVVAKDGSSMFIDVDESNDMPTRVFLKPDKNSDEGFTLFFKENGLPDKMVVDGHILYYGNFNGYKYDLAIIYPDNRIEYHYDIETDVNWDAYSASAPGLFKVSSSGNIFKTLLPFVLPTVTCSVTIFVPNPLTATMCASSTIKLVVGAAFDGFTEGAGKALVDVMFCASGSLGSCLMGLISSASLLSYLDFNLTEQKAEQINEAIRKIDGDGMTIIPHDLLEDLLMLGIEVNNGNNPPNIEGTYVISPHVLVRSNFYDSYSPGYEFSDGELTFSNQDNAKMTVGVNYAYTSASGGGTSVSSFITGSGNKFSVFSEIHGTNQNGYSYSSVDIYSGEITSSGIKNYQNAFIVTESAYGTIDRGQGRLVKDSDEFSEKLDPNQPGLVNNPISLAADIWTAGSITSGRLNEMWYSFNVVSGTTYNIWWSDSDAGNGSHTLDIRVSAQYENGTSIFSGIDNAYSTPQTFTANQTGIVKIKVYPYSSGRTGTYALSYSVGSTAIRPLAKTTTFFEKALPVNQVQGIKKAPPKTIPSEAARH